MRILALLILVFLFFQACNTGSQNRESHQQTSEKRGLSSFDFSIDPGKRIGLITATSTEGKLRIDYGPENIHSQQLPIGEGEESLGAILFQDTRNELELFWAPTTYPPRPSFARISKDSTQWKTLDGVSIGTSIEELEKINGKPFWFYGFEWDYAGLVVSWDGGQLSEYLIVALIPGNFEALAPEFFGEIKLRSDDPKIKSLELKVGSMVIGFEED